MSLRNKSLGAGVVSAKHSRLAKNGQDGPEVYQQRVGGTAYSQKFNGANSKYQNQAPRVPPPPSGAEPISNEDFMKIFGGS